MKELVLSTNHHYHQFIDSGTANYILSSGGSFVGSPAKVNYDGIFISGLNRGLGEHNYCSRTTTIIRAHTHKLVPLQVQVVVVLENLQQILFSVASFVWK